ncbi:VCBS repeat-containing protein [Anditalea andensis]|uniref:ASPIC/UnbV domain-containing protein n=1 Tax=Anditalea andensis TaxID=1048983 RepID=A0A074KZF2_9BACT|nr:VCBS repeat-containing protein [Anditalea andensis]KEO72998.1 hypothetical protein EL17_15405 [Anditalea andensis]
MIVEIRIFVPFLLWTACLWACTGPASENQTLFELIPAEQSGIFFSNNLKETALANILTYQYFYNGGGVAVGDVNNDGLMDLFFTGNMTSNKLYLNKGDLKFQDITLATGTAGREEHWTTGAVMVDINGNGLMDIYVCYSGNLPSDARRNQLFVNQGIDEQGIPYFEEMAKAYGIDDPGYSTSALFFDYDLDGDLDLMLLQHNPELYSNLDESNYRKRLQEHSPDMSSKLFKNNDGIFEDVTLEAGLSGTPLSYGLGGNVADVNGDGYPDIYIANDYSAPDYLYINNGNGTFSDRINEQIGHTSLYTMGMDIADFNNDGLLDIYTLDMLPEDNRRQKLLFSPENYDHFDLFVKVGLHHQYMRNMLQMNNGNGTFSEIGQLAGISNTDWSWTPLFADFNNSGKKDLFVSNGFLKDLTNLDFINNRKEYLQNQKVTQNGLIELIHTMPTTPLQNYIFENQGNLRFSNMANDWGLNQLSNSNGAVYVDLDNDGDLELVINNINQSAFLYKNNSRESQQSNFLQIELEGKNKNTLALGTKVTIYSDGQLQMQEQTLYKGYQGNVGPVLHFGLGDWKRIDSLIVNWPGGSSESIIHPEYNQRLVLSASNANTPAKEKICTSPKWISEPSISELAHSNIIFNDFNRQSQLMENLSAKGPVLIKADVNGDGLEDIFLGGGYGEAGKIFIQNKNGEFNKSNAFSEYNAEAVDVHAAFLDANGNGHLDLYIVRGGYHQFKSRDQKLRDELYINDGNGNFTKSTVGTIPEIFNSSSVVVPMDINNDGYTDLFIGGTYVPGRFPESDESYVLLNKGNGAFKMISGDEWPILSSLKRINDAVVTDINKDGSQELVIASEWAPIYILSSYGNRLENITDKLIDENFRGLWKCLLITDLNGDGQVELILGNHGLNSPYRASRKEPMQLHFADFDQNGSVDPILSYYIHGKRYPILSRDELAAQMYRKKAVFSSYGQYAEATLEDILTKAEIDKAEILEINTLETMLFILKNGKYIVSPLPYQVQMAPVKSVISLEGKPKALFFAGNSNYSRIKIGKIDGNYGILLKADDNFEYSYTSQYISGFRVNGDVNSTLNINGSLYIGIHNQPVAIYKPLE